MSRNSPTKIASDCVTTVMVLGIIGVLVGGAALGGLAETINAIGAGVRWAFG